MEIPRENERRARDGKRGDVRKLLKLQGRKAKRRQSILGDDYQQANTEGGE